jgi:hypothetical protein
MPVYELEILEPQGSVTRCEHASPAPTNDSSAP